jgi:hypothetical protein
MNSFVMPRFGFNAAHSNQPVLKKPVHANLPKNSWPVVSETAFTDVVLLKHPKHPAFGAHPGGGGPVLNDYGMSATGGMGGDDGDDPFRRPQETIVVTDF